MKKNKLFTANDIHIKASKVQIEEPLKKDLYGIRH